MSGVKAFSGVRVHYTGNGNPSGKELVHLLPGNSAAYAPLRINCVRLIAGGTDMKHRFRRSVNEQKKAIVAYLAANSEARLCDDCLRRILKVHRNLLNERDIFNVALEAGLVRKNGLCPGCGVERLITSTR
jgi:hypothetical protein